MTGRRSNQLSYAPLDTGDGDRPAGIISGSLDLQLEGAARGAGGADRDPQAGLVADGVVDLLAEAEAVARGAQDAAGRSPQDRGRSGACRPGAG